MIALNHHGKWVLSLWILAICVLPLWVTCTQKSPINPTQSLQDEIPLLTSMSASPTQIAAGGAQSEIYVRLVDENGVPIADAVVVFSSNIGTIQASDTTDADGWAMALFLSGQEAGEALITANYNQVVSSTVTIRIISSIQANIQIETDAESILANGWDSAEITVALVADSSKPVVGAVVSFSTTVGQIPANAVTGSEGRAVVSLTSIASTRDTVATVTATVDSLFAGLVVSFRGVSFDVQATPASILADGQSTATVTALLKESTSQIAVANAPVIFSTDLGLIPNQETTDIQGVASVPLTSGTVPGTAHVVAYYGRFPSDTVSVDFIPASESPYTFSELSVGASKILGDGQDQVTVTARVIDTDRNPVSNDSVRFVTTAGVFSEAWVLTDADGIAVSILKANASRADSTATVTASRGRGQQSVTAQILFEGVSMDLSADPVTILADGQSTSTLTLLLKKTTSQIAISGAVIYFGTNLGTVPNQAVTDAQGVARVSLTSGSTTGTAHVVATYGATLLDTADVVIATEAPVSYTLQDVLRSPSAILSNGIDQATITARVVDSRLNPVSGVLVEFSATAGSIQSQAITDENGLAIVSLTSIANENDLSSQITARMNTQILTTNVTFLGVNMQISASPGTIIADGQSQSEIKVVIKETTSHIAIPDGSVYFSTTLGTIPNTSMTNNAGVATVSLSSGSSVGNATVVARYGNTIRDTVIVAFQPSIPTYLDVTASPPVIPADGQTESIIKATVNDATQNPVPDGIPVNFNIIEGIGGTIVNQRVTVNGVASSALTSTAQGIIKIRVSVGSLADTVDVVCTVGEVNQVLVTADRDSMMADGIETASIEAKVMDAQGNPVSGITVQFTASLGDITQNAPTNSEGVASAQFTSSVVGTATITATVGNVVGTKIIRLLPGGPNSIVLRFNPTSIGVRATGQVQTAIVEAEVRDSKNNPVIDATMVQFSILAGPGGGEELSTDDPIPTVGGIARVALSSGTVSGNVRVQAEVIDDEGNPVIAIASEILIHAGEPYIEDVNDIRTTHLTVAANRLNIWTVLDTTKISIMVLDKYNNPVQQGTAVYLTTSGGGVNTHTAYTDDYGKAQVILTSGNPQPTIDRFYHYTGIEDPNLKTVIPGYVYYPDLDEWLLPNFDAFPDADYPGTVGGRILNTEGDLLENDGITRVIAYTEGQDATGDSVRAWDWLAVVYSGYIRTFEDNSAVSLPATLHPGESATVRICIMDGNGNPIASGSTITAAVIPEDAQARLSWYELVTGRDQGAAYYYITISNAIDPKDPKPGLANIKISVDSVNGRLAIVTNSVFISDT